MRLPIISLPALLLLATPAFAQDSVQETSAAGTASSEVATHLTASGVKTAVGVSAVPVVIGGSVAAVGGSTAVQSGAASLGVADGASDAARASGAAASGPLKVDDRVVVSPDPAPHVPYDTKPR
jgi:hypothetical protein